MRNSTPVTNDVLLVESIGTPFVPVGWRVWTVIAVGVSFPVDGSSSWVTESSGRPRSPRVRSSPCSAAWSTTGPSMTVVPSACVVSLIPSNRAAQRAPRCPLRRISYRPAPCEWPADVSVIALPSLACGPSGRPQGRRRCGEQTSPHVVSSVVILSVPDRQEVRAQRPTDGRTVDPDRLVPVVLGSAVYAGHWLKPARELAARCGPCPGGSAGVAVLQRPRR